MRVNKLICGLGVAVFALGAFEAWQVRDFLAHSHEVEATVTLVEERRGPPKPRQKTPLHVVYRTQAGSEMSAITHLPMLQQIRVGDSIRLRADSRNPQVVRLPLWSELWARCLTYCMGGVLLVLVAKVLGAKRS
jgi:hypothetical protein